MHFLNRNLSFIRFRVVGKLALSDEVFQENLEKNRFKDLSEMSVLDEESFGWVSPENCLESPEMRQVALDPYFKLMMRVDRRRVPSALLSAHLAIEERAVLETSGKNRLSRQDRRELKSTVKEFLLGKAVPTSALYRAVWNYREKTCFLLSTNKGVQKRFCKLFKDTFSCELEPMTAWSMACSWAVEHNAKPAVQALIPFSLQEREF